jgi:ubiquinone/menaquinone biosynthesis C-methylase UbiE
MSQYLLPRDNDEKQRLKLQHSVLVRQFNGYLPSLISVGSQDRILDSCCGTGVWSIDLASQLPPTVVIEAIDISPANFPDKATEDIPANIYFSTGNVLSLPAYWTDSFDIVYQRLLMAGLNMAGWVIALQELYRVTRSGGYLVLLEADTGAFTGHLIASAPATRQLRDLFTTLLDSNDMISHPGSTLPQLLSESGFQVLEVEKKICSVEGAHATLLFDSDATDEIRLLNETLVNMVRLLQSTRPAMMAAELISGERFDALIDEMAHEWKDIPKTQCGRGCPWVRICARKPLS